MKRKTLTAQTPADLIDKIRKVEGWPREEGDSLRVTIAAKKVYDFGKTITHYTAVPR